MTDTTTVASLKKQIDTAADIIRDLTDRLEAERQRADDRAKENYRNKCDVDNCMETIANLEAEIAALKGDQVPVGFAVMDENHDWHIDFCGKEHALSHGDSLFTAPQKPVVLPSPYYGDRHCLDKREVIAAIEAAGGIVKDGEL